MDSNSNENFSNTTIIIIIIIIICILACSFMAFNNLSSQSTDQQPYFLLPQMLDQQSQQIPQNFDNKQHENHQYEYINQFNNNASIEGHTSQQHNFNQDDTPTI